MVPGAQLLTVSGTEFAAGSGRDAGSTCALASHYLFLAGRAAAVPAVLQLDHIMTSVT